MFYSFLSLLFVSLIGVSPAQERLHPATQLPDDATLSIAIESISHQRKDSSWYCTDLFYVKIILTPKRTARASEASSPTVLAQTTDVLCPSGEAVSGDSDDSPLWSIQIPLHEIHHVLRDRNMGTLEVQLWENEWGLDQPIAFNGKNDGRSFTFSSSKQKRSKTLKRFFPKKKSFLLTDSDTRKIIEKQKIPPVQRPKLWSEEEPLYFPDGFGGDERELEYDVETTYSEKVEKARGFRLRFSVEIILPSKTSAE